MGQGSAVRTVSDQLSDLITEGGFPPGSKVSDAALALQLGVSRNTVREAFRLLAHEGLLIHEFNRGVFVPTLTSADVRDVYRLRVVIEPQVVRSLTPPDVHRLGRLRNAVRESQAASEELDWVRVGTGNMHFHRSLVSLAGSPRLDVTMRRLMAELRLVFAVIADPQSLYEPFVVRNADLLGMLEAGKFEEGASFLRDYLRDSEGQILAAFEEQSSA